MRRSVGEVGCDGWWLEAFDDLGGRDALAILAIAATPAAGQHLSLSKIQSALEPVKLFV